MAKINRFYGRSRVIDGKIFSVPRYIRENIDFSDIPGKEFLVQEGDRLDIIAEQIYGNPELWREIAVYNNIGYFFDVKPETIIKLPFDINKVTERL